MLPIMSTPWACQPYFPISIGDGVKVIHLWYQSEDYFAHGGAQYGHDHQTGEGAEKDCYPRMSRCHDRGDQEGLVPCIISDVHPIRDPKPG